MNKIRYIIDGKDFTEFGVNVLNIEGIFDLPKRKIAYRHSWDEVSGEDIDLAQVALESRIIKLDCIVSGDSISQAYTKLAAFFALVDTPGAKQLTIEYDNLKVPAPALSFLIFREEPVKVDKIFRFGKNVWKFPLSLQEYLPYKSVYRFNVVSRSDLSIQFTALTRPVILATGDGRLTTIEEVNTYQFDYMADGSYVVSIFSNHPSDFAVGNTNASFIWKM